MVNPEPRPALTDLELSNAPKSSRMSPEFPKSRRAPGLFWLVVILYVVASSARAEEESYGFLSFEECCTDIGFRVDETILMNTQGSRCR